MGDNHLHFTAPNKTKKNKIKEGEPKREKGRRKKERGEKALAHVYCEVQHNANSSI